MDDGPVVVAASSSMNRYANNPMVYNNNYEYNRNPFSDAVPFAERRKENEIKSIDSEPMKGDGYDQIEQNINKDIDQDVHGNEKDIDNHADLNEYSSNAVIPNSIVLEEEIDKDYEPTKEEIIEYALFLGMDPVEDAELLWIARQGLITPLPEEWKPCKTTDTNEMYYFNFKTGASLWAHPLDTHFKELYKSEKDKLAMANQIKSKQHHGIEQMIDSGIAIEDRNMNKQALNQKGNQIDDGINYTELSNNSGGNKRAFVEENVKNLPKLISSSSPKSILASPMNNNQSSASYNDGRLDNYQGIKSAYSPLSNAMPEPLLNIQHQSQQSPKAKNPFQDKYTYAMHSAQNYDSFMLRDLISQVDFLNRQFEDSINERETLRMQLLLTENRLFNVERKLNSTQQDYERLRNRLAISSETAYNQMLSMQSSYDELLNQYQRSEMARERAEQQLLEMQRKYDQRESQVYRNS